MSVDIVSALSGLLAATSLWISRKNQSNIEVERAIVDLSQALRQTKMYIRSMQIEHDTADHLNIRQGRNWEIEGRLADIWDKAAFSCRRIDKSVASMASVKSGFWQDVSQWSREDITRHGIALEDAEKKINELKNKLGFGD